MWGARRESAPSSDYLNVYNNGYITWGGMIRDHREIFRSMGRPLQPLLLLLLGLALVVAGCAGSGKARDQPSYKGERKEFDLYLYEKKVGTANGGWQLYPGAEVDAWLFSPDTSSLKATLPGPTIRVKQYDTVVINFITQGAPMAHTLHWHGVHVPWDMDGVPYVSQLPIGDSNFDGHGKSFTYTFQVKQTGTFWYHCHVDTAHHMDMGMYGAFIVEPADASQDPPYDVEAILSFDEWDRSHSHQNAMAIQSAISRSGDPRLTANDLYAHIRDYLLMTEVYNDTVAGGPLKNSPGVRETRTWYPITYAPYFAEYDTFLINGKAFPDTAPILVKTGQTLRMRLINVGEEVHAIHLHGHYMYVTHTDGARVPLLEQRGDNSGLRGEAELAKYAMRKDTILIGPGERYDVYVVLNNPGPWMLHDHISLNEMNDYISPGGMMTMVCYEDGWPNAKKCAEGHKALHGGHEYTSGDIVMESYRFLLDQERLPGMGGGSGLPATSPKLPTGSAPATTPVSSGGPGLPSLPVQHIH